LSKWTLPQKLILVGVVSRPSSGYCPRVGISSPAMTPLIDTPIADEDAREKIVLRLNEENVRTSVSPTGVISVADEATARRLRAILIREDLIPKNVDPWALFDIERWTITDFERNVTSAGRSSWKCATHQGPGRHRHASVVVISPENAVAGPNPDLGERRSLPEARQRTSPPTVEGRGNPELLK
jgi:hypothetical protein